MTWKQWWYLKRYNFRRRIGDTHVGDEWVSTIYIGVPGMYLDKSYETMVFGNYDEGLQVRYATRKEAKKGHWEIVNRLRQDKYGLAA